MENTLRIRELSRNTSGAVYKNVDTQTGINIRRDTAHAAMTREVGELTESITFIPDTHHNRCMLVRRQDVEVACFEKGKWRVIPKTWLEEVFKPAEGAKPLPLELKKASPAPAPIKFSNKPEAPQTVIKCADDLLKLSKSNQLAAINGLIGAKNIDEAFQKTLLEALSTSVDAKLSPKVKELATKALAGS